MSASDKDREAARLLFVAWDADPDSRQQVQRAIEAIATARAEGYRAGLEAAAKVVAPITDNGHLVRQHICCADAVAAILAPEVKP